MCKRALVAAAVSLSVGMLMLFRTLHGSDSPQREATPLKVGDYMLTGPYTHDNLTVFLICGKDRLKDKVYLTLQEAMEQKLVVVHETGNVNELSVENISPDQEVYIQSGDIVKGGRQDRMIAIDFILPARSGQMPINAFCVESGRWKQRGNEAADHFASSTDAVAGKDLKLAAKERMDQGGVWREVAANQRKLSDNTGQSVNAAASESSFQLSLESKPVEDRIASYLKAMEPIIRGHDDAIGYAFAINGKVNSADVYANHALFAKLWPKLIKSSAVEAVADLTTNRLTGEASTADVYQCMNDAEKGRASQTDVTPRVQLITRETEQNVLFETVDRAATTQPVHENFVNKK